ncbi:MAG: hypothetical protein LBT69_02675 [Lactobacillales bacterium]|nr:hypothetical protein [Lactobacillales bacterium]
MWQIIHLIPDFIVSCSSKKLSCSTSSRVVFIGLYGAASSLEAVYSAMKGAQVAFVKSYAKKWKERLVSSGEKTRNGG